jgi:hypothetical protein
MVPTTKISLQHKRFHNQHHRFGKPKWGAEALDHGRDRGRAAELRLHGSRAALADRGVNQHTGGDNVTSSPERGNSAAYLAATAAGLHSS